MTAPEPDITFIYADIETDSLGATKLLQIAAVSDKEDVFNIFINPQQELPLSCTNFCGFYMYRGQLYRNGILLPSVTVRTALRSFSDWLAAFKKPVILVFHNGFSFDCNVLARYFLKFNITIPANVLKVADSLLSFRKNIKTTDIEDHKLTTLSKYFKVEHALVHDALSDSLALKNICEAFIDDRKITLRNFLKDYEKDFEHFIKRIKLRQNGSKANNSPHHTL